MEIDDTLRDAVLPDANHAGGRAPFLALIAANAVSMHGNALAQLAVPWFVLATTGSATRTGVVAAVGLVPYVLGSALSGVVVDRFRYRTVSVISDIASMVAVALIPLLHAVDLLSFPLLLVLVFMGAILDTPGATARSALMPDVARRAGLRLERANATHEVIESGAGFVGPLLAGLLIAAVGASATLWFDAATFGLSALLIAALVPATRHERVEPGDGRRQIRDDLRDGVNFVLRDSVIRAIYLPSTVLTFLISPLFGVVLPFHVREATGSAISLGILIGAFGGGSVLGAVIFGVFGHRMPRRGTFVSGVCAIGVAFAVVSALPSIAVMAVALGLAGIVAGPNGPLVATVLQERTPEELRGRVFGATTAMSFAASPLGVLVAGVAIERVGVQSTVVVMTAIFACTVVWMAQDPGLHAM